MGNDQQIWTVGHSTREDSEFGRLLNSFQIKTLVDVRSFPASRRFPQFNKIALSEFLGNLEIKYTHIPLLGGLRKPKADSHNTSWRNASFRGYADYMETDPFVDGIHELVDLARVDRVAIMCAESLWWRCHRSLIADYLKSKRWTVLHILAEGKVEEHPYTAAAKIVNGELAYRGLLDA